MSAFFVQETKECSWRERNKNVLGEKREICATKHCLNEAELSKCQNKVISLTFIQTANPLAFMGFQQDSFECPHLIFDTEF